MKDLKAYNNITLNHLACCDTLRTAQQNGSNSNRKINQAYPPLPAMDIEKHRSYKFCDLCDVRFWQK